MSEIILDQDIEKAKSYFFSGISCFENKKYEEAENYYKLSLSIVPDHLGIMTNLTTTYFKLGKLIQAAELINKILKIFPYCVFWPT